MVPIELARMTPRSQSIEWLKMAMPEPSLPSRFAAGTRHIVEDQLAHGRGAETHLVERCSDRQAGRVTRRRGRPRGRRRPLSDR